MVDILGEGQIVCIRLKDPKYDTFHKFEQVPVVLNNISDGISPKSLDSLIMNLKNGKMWNISGTNLSRINRAIPIFSIPWSDRTQRDQ